jgi:hypothetical protein
MGALCLDMRIANAVCTSKTIRGPAVVKGKRFFDSVMGDYIPIKGIAYYPRPNEGDLSLSDSIDFFTLEYQDLWEADVEYFKDLGINTIRIYGVNPSINHDAFMCALRIAGIYVIIGLLADCQDCGIGPNQAPSCYPATLKERGQRIIHTFSHYDNVLAFSAGNEVALYAVDRETALNAPCQKQFLRDMRAYILGCRSSRGMRAIPVGVVTGDFDRGLNALYYACRTNPLDLLENAEWYGLNTYRHCDPKAVTIDDLAGYIALKADFQNYSLPIPVVIAEFGCRERFPQIGQFEAQRTWLQMDAIYNPDYTQVFAGGVVFEYSAEKKQVDQSAQNQPWPYYKFMKIQYGVGYYSPVDCNHQDIPCTYNPYPEFDLLADKFAAIDASFVPSFDAFTPPSLLIPDCPAGIAAVGDFEWPSDLELDFACPVFPTGSSASTSVCISACDSAAPSDFPSQAPSISPSTSQTPSTRSPPSGNPSLLPSSGLLSGSPSFGPSLSPSEQPSTAPSIIPSSSIPSVYPSISPSTDPSSFPTTPSPSSSTVLLPTNAALSSEPSLAPTITAPTLSPSTTALPSSNTFAPSSEPLTTSPTTDGKTIDNSNSSSAWTIDPSSTFSALLFVGAGLLF